MSGAFQSDAFQSDAFQMDTVIAVPGRACITIATASAMVTTLSARATVTASVLDC